MRVPGIETRCDACGLTFCCPCTRVVVVASTFDSHAVVACPKCGQDLGMPLDQALADYLVNGGAEFRPVPLFTDDDVINLDVDNLIEGIMRHEGVIE